MAPHTFDGLDPVRDPALREDDTGSPPPPDASAASAPAGELALNRLLEAEPRSVLLNIRKADLRAAAGDDDLACYFYRRALQAAGERPLP